MATPPEIQHLLTQLEPILRRWYRDGTLGEIAIVFGQHQMQPEERPRKRLDAVRFERDDGRAKPIETVR
jgi:hypothetical protein